MQLTSEEGTGDAWTAGGRKRAEKGLSEEEREQGSETSRDVS